MVKLEALGRDSSATSVASGEVRRPLVQDAVAVVLAGGRSARMGTDKALLDFDGKPLIARLLDRLRPEFAEVIVSSNSPQTYALLGVDVVPDEEPDMGPLGAIVSCLARSSRDLHFVVACDMPSVRMDAVHRLLAIAREQECDAVIPVSAEGLYEPLLAVYRRSVLDPARAILARGGRRVVDLLREVRVVHPKVERESVTNINTPEDYARALAAWRAAQRTDS